MKINIRAYETFNQLATHLVIEVNEFMNDLDIIRSNIGPKELLHKSFNELIEKLREYPLESVIMGQHPANARKLTEDEKAKADLIYGSDPNG